MQSEPPPESRRFVTLSDAARARAEGVKVADGRPA
jgi:hypothetical protein